MSDEQIDDMEQLIAQLAPETTRARRSGVLRPINRGLLVLTLLGLLIMFFNGTPNLISYAIVIGSAAFNLLVVWLDRAGYTAAAANLFANWINLGIILLSGLNLLSEQNLIVGMIFAAVLSMSVLLAGILINVRAAWIFAIGDSLLILAMLEYYFRVVEPVTDRSAFSSALATSVPVIGLLLIVALISWLFQRALAAAEQRIEMARRRIMHDELLRRDLAIARELQQRLYPPPPLTNANLVIASRSEPARETSGDFYDFIDLPDDRLGIVVADVTGKSIAAALVMAMARGAIRSESTRALSPAAVLTAANETLCRDRSVRQMITAFYGVLDTQNLTLTFSNAGHPFPMLRRNGALHEIEVCGLPLSARADAIYTEHTIQLEPGDQLVLLSDGVIEEQNPQRELFGFDRLIDTISSTVGHDPHQMLARIWDAVRMFRGDSEQSDDITVVVIQVASAAPIGHTPEQPASIAR
ncbi:MAG: SpoIIE family protein phosphatase [Oscillochloris sp.]|nr:SpoIIE family protein phosphatase [Oscillochloris sp.]